MKKILLSFLVSLILFFSLAPFFQAQAQDSGNWYSQNPFEWYVKVFDEETSPPNEIFGERYTAAQVQWVIWSIIFAPIRFVEIIVDEKAIMCVFKRIGTNTIDLGDCVTGITSTIQKIFSFIFPKISAYDNKPLLSLVFESNGRDISGIGYAKDLIKKFSPVSEVKAQSYGYQGLTWLQKYWKGFRDISYTLLVLVVIVFAFMIMFRVKLNPQTVISIQSALPKVIIATIFITFSYAIAGLAIDLMYVVSGLFTLLLKLAGFSKDASTAFGIISGTGLVYSVAGGFSIFFIMLGYTVVFFISGFASLIGTFVSGISIFGMIVSIIFIILSVWVLVLCLIYTIKIPYVLLKTLISLYISIITAPVQILAGTIAPSMGFGSWFKRLMADILVFPVTGLLIWFSWATLGLSFGKAFGAVGQGWEKWGMTSSSVPSFETTTWAPGIIGSAEKMGGIIFLAISFGIIVLIPKVPELLKSIFLGEKFAFGTAMGEAYGPIKPIVGMATGMVGQSAQRAALVPTLGWARSHLAEGNVLRRGLEGWAREQKMVAELPRGQAGQGVKSRKEAMRGG